MQIADGRATSCENAENRMAETKNLAALVQRSRSFELPDGRTVELRPLTLRDWGTIEEESVQAAKRDMIQTVARNADLLPENLREKMLLEVFKRAEELRADNLPSIKVSVSQKAANGLPLYDNDGKMVMQDVELGYAQFWLSRSMKGRLTAVWLSVRKSLPGATQDEVAEIFAEYSERTLDEAADVVGSLSKPTLGNVEPSPAAA